jgi:hypothetical protein
LKQGPRSASRSPTGDADPARAFGSLRPPPAARAWDDAQTVGEGVGGSSSQRRDRLHDGKSRRRERLNRTQEVAGSSPASSMNPCKSGRFSSARASGDHSGALYGEIRAAEPAIQVILKSSANGCRPRRAGVAGLSWRADAHREEVPFAGHAPKVL